MNILHKWRFFRSGGFDQVHLNSSADLKSLSELDPKLWAALSCPTDNLEFDSKTLEFIDTNKDGHIRVPEIIAAVNWTTSLLKNPEDMIRGSNSLPLNAIEDETEEGALLLASAKEILLNIGKGEEPAITVEDTADLSKIFANTKYNGDGIIPSSTAPDPNTQAVIEEIIDCIGSEIDRSGLPGVSEEKVKQFYTEANAFSEWWREAEKDSINILLLGDETQTAKTAFDRVKLKIDDYFTRCRLAEFDQRASDPLNPALTEYEALTRKNLSADSEEVAAFPLAKVEAKKPLPLASGINPAWIEALAEFKEKVVMPLLGNKDNLSNGDWLELCDKFSAYQTWLKAKRGAAVESLGIKRVRTILSGGYREKIMLLIQKDKSHSGTADAINSVEKLIRFHCYLFQLLDNFVSFHDFYTAQNKAIFQAGTLYLDGRSCDFCLHVTDINKHSSMANLSGTYLAYCECQRSDDESKKMTIVAAFTNGDSDNLMVGRNGIFYDRKGQDWNATIVKIIEHPISVRQALWYPYKRIGKMIGEQIEKIVSAREKAIQNQAASSIVNTTQTMDTGKASPAPFDVGKFAGIFAAIGLAIGAIGTAIASVVTGFISLVWWKMPLVILGLFLLISGPSVILAYLKLRKRNLAPMLDGNGWAVNTRAIINIPFGTSLTKIASLPPGAQRSLIDPYAEKERPWKLYLFLILLLSSIMYFWINDYFYQSTSEDAQKQLPGKKSGAIVENETKLDDARSKNKAPDAPQSMNSLKSESSSATIVPSPKPINH
ncbi:hypothetical protein [Nitrosomonas supralitoralis]|uniref:EF-hand domain-containing protein n=1 Tax=Nitrosomonas supralitoralis TaxID=2116706 RepID=A0A2P7NTN3_9PROT|nr:hypothetical protein [Nitrosomonas supralitoralis]PSJ16805.1 hypothetical protein C7H79_11670 [Nitrosomonas supralitoralis]